MMVSIVFADEIREAFEKWYCDTYWNFKNNNIRYDSETDSYHHYTVDVAYNAYRAGFVSGKYFKK